MSESPHNSFRTTRWTQVVAAKGRTHEAKQALRELCETYYAPVELFVRRYRSARNPHADDARDLTHEFFAKLLEGNGLGSADRTRGRFRSYLLGAVKHFLSDQADREQALKRGGGETRLSLSASRAVGASDEASALIESISAPHGFPPDAEFDRQWAITVIEHATTTLRQEAVDAEQLARFEILQPWLVTPYSHDTAIAAAHSLQLSDAAFKVAIHRLRKRFRQVIVARISETVTDPAEAQQELNDLLAALVQSATS